MTDYTPDTEEVRELYWAVSGDPRRDSKAWGEFDRWLRKVKAEAWTEGYEAGAKDQSECEGHRYRDTPQMRKLGFDHWTTNPYES